jgi:hypothetical protein
MINLKKQLSFLLVIISTNSFAQNISQKYAETITISDLKRHLEIIASDDMEGRESGSKGQFKAARYIVKEFEQLGLERIVENGEYKSYFQWFDVYKNGSTQILKLNSKQHEKDFEKLATMNILGFLQGKSKPEEVIVISAHYDHIGISKSGEINNGADDDGSGTAAVLELAEAFVKAKKEGNGPERSILFILFTGEEKGLLGSKHYADFEPIIPLKNIICNLNIDMIGRKDDKHETDQYLYLIGADKISKDLDSISKTINKDKLGFEIDYTYNNEEDPNRFYYRSDHYNFAKHNVPIVFFFTGVHEDYHKSGDDVEKILFPKYSKISQYIFYIAWEVANRQKRL